MLIQKSNLELFYLRLSESKCTFYPRTHKNFDVNYKVPVSFVSIEEDNSLHLDLRNFQWQWEKTFYYSIVGANALMVGPSGPRGVKGSAVEQYVIVPWRLDPK